MPSPTALDHRTSPSKTIFGLSVFPSGLGLADARLLRPSFYTSASSPEQTRTDTWETRLSRHVGARTSQVTAEPDTSGHAPHTLSGH